MDDDEREATDTESRGPIEIPWERLSDEALRGVLEEFITREGTDYGEREIALETKVEQVRRQLERGQVRVLFDPTSKSINLVTEREAKALLDAHPTRRGQ